MPVLARTIEEAGLSTILVTNMPFWAERIGTPRTLAVEFPFGHILGEPNNGDQQMTVIQQALAVLVESEEAGTIVHSPEKWPVNVDEAMKDWQPREPSPVIAHMSSHLKKTIRESRINR